MVMATGLLRALAHAHPTIDIDVLASPLNATVLAGHRSWVALRVAPRERQFAFGQGRRGSWRRRWRAGRRGLRYGCGCLRRARLGGRQRASHDHWLVHPRRSDGSHTAGV